jgi:hypothetical protein
VGEGRELVTSLEEGGHEVNKDRPLKGSLKEACKMSEGVVYLRLGEGSTGVGDEKRVVRAEG